MDLRLYQAALTGNVAILKELLQEDERILDGIPIQEEFGINETPLHTSALLGHVEFAREILSHKPELACKPNSQGSLPLHLAAAKGHVAIVQELLKLNEKISCMCLARDRKGQTPLHVAAAADRVQVLKELVSARPEAMHAPNLEGDSVFHLCVKRNHFEALELWVNSASAANLINFKDSEDNTVLHLATAKKNIQMLEIILGVDGVDVEAKNKHGFTALDVVGQSPREKGDGKIVEILENAGCKRATNGRKRNAEDLMKEGQMKEIRKHYLIAATVIATVTFTAGFTPPGGVWTEEPPAEAPTPSKPYLLEPYLPQPYLPRQDIHRPFLFQPDFLEPPADHGDPGTAILSTKGLFYGFLVCNTIAFLASCSAIILLLITWKLTPVKFQCLKMLLSSAMAIAIVSLISAFCLGAALVSLQEHLIPVRLIGFYVWGLVILISFFAYKYFVNKYLPIRKLFSNCKGRRSRGTPHVV